MFVINLLLAFLASFLLRDEGGAAGGTDGSGGDAGKDDKGAAGGAPAPGPDPEAGKTLTQDEVNRIVAERVRKEREKYSDYDVLKDKASKHDAAEEAKKTEDQKAKEKREADERAAAERITAADRRLVAAEIKSQAAGRVHNLDHVVLLLSSDPSIKVAADGTSVEGAKEALESLLKEHPYLEKKATGTPPKGASGGEFNGQDSKTLDEKIAEAESKGDFRESTRLKLQKARAAS